MDAGGAGATRYTQEGSNPLRRDWGTLRSSGVGRRAAQLQEVSDVFLGEGQSTAKETEGAEALCRGQEAAGEAGRRGPPGSLWKPQ